MNKKAYETFATFLHEAGAKLGRSFCNDPMACTGSMEEPCKQAKLAPSSSDEADEALSIDQSDLLLRLEVLHVLRCLVGPLVESTIIQDRYYWLKENLASSEPIQSSPKKSQYGLPTSKMSVKLVNLFDQGMDSGRNVAIVVGPESALDLV